MIGSGIQVKILSSVGYLYATQNFDILTNLVRPFSVEYRHFQVSHHLSHNFAKKSLLRWPVGCLAKRRRTCSTGVAEESSRLICLVGSVTQSDDWLKPSTSQLHIQPNPTPAGCSPIRCHTKPLL